MNRNRRIRSRWLSLLTMLLVPLGWPRPAWAPLQATSFVVNSNADLPDANLGDGLCLTANNNCTLRAAIEQANTSPFGSTITFSSNMTIIPTSPLPAIVEDDITISGLGRNIILDGSLAGVTASGLHIQGGGNVVHRLTLRNWGRAGVLIDGTASQAQYNVIGTNGDGVSDADERLILTGNFAYGVEIVGPLAGFNIVAGNQLGSGSSPNQTGVRIAEKAHHNRIGTNGDGVADAAERNIIIGNTVSGIGITDSTGNIIAGNYIGLEANGSTATGNGAGIILAAGAHGNRIGTDGDGVGDTEERNVISGNKTVAGIDLQDSNSNVIAGNYIGTNAAGTAARGNVFGGIEMGPNASNNVIGTNGDGAGDDHEGNVISANGSPTFDRGILLLSASNNTVAGNRIGTNAAGTAALPNQGSGISLANANNNTIGTNGDGVSDAFEGNLISGNLASGIFLRASNNRIAGNRIGTDISGTAPLGNGDLGIWVFSLEAGANGNMIGGVTPERGNVIAYNGSTGVHIGKGSSGAAVNNAVLSNSIFSNGELGIDLSKTGATPEGVTPNDNGDKDSGPNDLMNHPELTGASSLLSSTYVNVQIVNGAPNAAFRVQLFASPDCDPSGQGEGRTYLGQTFMSTDGSGNAPSKFVALSASTPLGAFVTATATREDGGRRSTSEFSPCVVVEPAPLPYIAAGLKAGILGLIEETSGEAPWLGGATFGLLVIGGAGLAGLWRLVRGRGDLLRFLLMGGGGGALFGLLFLGVGRLVPTLERIPPFVPLPPAPPPPTTTASPIGPAATATATLETAATATATPTETAAPSGEPISGPTASTDVFYFEADTCGPTQVEVEAMANDAAITSLVLFYRLAEKDGPGRTEWTAMAMTPAGGGRYLRTLRSASDIPGIGTFLQAYLQLQVVGTDGQGNEVGRTPVNAAVMLLPCAGPGLLVP